MINAFKELIANQFEATFCMLGACVDRCPEADWQMPIANLTFNQAAFHALYYGDVYLGPDLKSLREQEFYQANAGILGDPKELRDRIPKTVYDRAFIQSYLKHCREKAAKVIAEETEDTLKRQPGFDWLEFSRAEVHVYNLRHLQHHTAHLSLRLRLDAGVEIPWVGSGWRELQ